MRAKCFRKTRETEIDLEINLYGSGKVKVDTPLGYVNHMLELLGVWAGFDLEIRAKGDLEVDVHHTIEDLGLCFGEGFSRALKDKTGIARVGWAKVPMDEALCEVILDLSGRPYFVYRNSEILPDIVFGEEKDVWREFFKSFCFRANMNLHIIFHYGENGHHLLESCFKSLGIAIRSALAKERSSLLTTKGVLE